jgi:hypothetical protein
MELHTFLWNISKRNSVSWMKHETEFRYPLRSQISFGNKWASSRVGMQRRAKTSKLSAKVGLGVDMGKLGYLFRFSFVFFLILKDN